MRPNSVVSDDASRRILRPAFSTGGLPVVCCCLFAAVFAALFFWCAPACAESKPADVLGVWKGIYTYPDKQGKMVEIKVVLNVLKQQGRSFVGIKTWIHPKTGKGLQEKISGTVGSDGKLYMIGQRNDMVVGTVKGDRMEMSFIPPGSVGTVAHYKLERE